MEIREKEEKEIKYEPEFEISGLRPRPPIDIGSNNTQRLSIKFDKYGKKSRVEQNGQIIRKTESGYNSNYCSIELNLDSRKSYPCIYRWEVQMIEKVEGMYFGIDSSDYHYLDGDYAVSGAVSALYSFGSPGNLYSKQKGGAKYGKKYAKDDIVMMEINTKDRTIEFHVNGESQGIAFKDDQINVDKIYRPAISMSGKDEAVKILKFEQEFI